MGKRFASVVPVLLFTILLTSSLNSQDLVISVKSTADSTEKIPCKVIVQSSQDSNRFERTTPFEMPVSEIPFFVLFRSTQKDKHITMTLKVPGNDDSKFKIRGIGPAGLIYSFDPTHRGFIGVGW